MKILKINEMIITSDEEVTNQTVLDILFDMGAKILNTSNNFAQTDILFEYNNQKAMLYFFTKRKTLQISHNNVIIKSIQKIQNVEDLVSVLNDLLKRVL